MNRRQRQLALVHLDAETLGEDIAAAVGGTARAIDLLREAGRLLERRGP
jgi:hypothetical protein